MMIALAAAAAIAPMLLANTVMREGGFIGGAFVAELPIMGVTIDNVIIAKVTDEDCRKGKGQIHFRVTREGRPYADQVRVFAISADTQPSILARALCAAGLRIVKPTH